jgi:hypothetical protein
MEEEPSHTVDVFRLERPPDGLWRGNARIALRARPLAVLDRCSPAPITGVF